MDVNDNYHHEDRKYNGYNNHIIQNSDDHNNKINHENEKNHENEIGDYKNENNDVHNNEWKPYEDPDSGVVFWCVYIYLRCVYILSYIHGHMNIDTYPYIYGYMCMIFIYIYMCI
jgi:hypothetical protein